MFSKVVFRFYKHHVDEQKIYRFKIYKSFAIDAIMFDLRNTWRRQSVYFLFWILSIHTWYASFIIQKLTVKELIDTTTSL